MAGRRVTEMAHRTASLLPEPPAAHDAFGALAWEELVLGTAARLAAVDPSPAPTAWSDGLLHLCPVTGRLDAEALHTLATVVEDAGMAAGEALLQMSVDAWRLRTRSVAPLLARNA